MMPTDTHGLLQLSLVLLMLGSFLLVHYKQHQAMEADTERMRQLNHESHAKAVEQARVISRQLDMTRRETDVGWFKPDWMSDGLGEILLIEKEAMQDWDIRFCMSVLPVERQTLCRPITASHANDVYWYAVQDAAYRKKEQDGTLERGDRANWTLVRQQLATATGWFDKASRRQQIMDDVEYDELRGDGNVVLARVVRNKVIMPPPSPPNIIRR